MFLILITYLSQEEIMVIDQTTASDVVYTHLQQNLIDKCHAVATYYYRLP